MSLQYIYLNYQIQYRAIHSERKRQIISNLSIKSTRKNKISYLFKIYKQHKTGFFSTSSALRFKSRRIESSDLTLCYFSQRLFLHPPTVTFCHFLCNTTNTTSLGVNRRTSLREVPSPLLIITGIPAVFCFKPVRKRLPYLEK